MPRESRLLPPSITAVVFVLLSVLVPLVLQRPLLNSDGDLARHLRHGRYMLEHGRLIRTDPFSFTRPGEPFLGFEYGSQLVYAAAERLGGLPAVAVLAGMVIGITYGLLTHFLRQRAVDPLLAYLTIGLAAALGAGHWTARPHLFSFVAVVVLLGILEGTVRKPGLACGVLFLVWANLHGGFIYGWILIGLYLVGSIGEMLMRPARAAWQERSRYYTAMLAVAVSVTLLNPRGWDLHRHVFGFFSQPYIMDHTAEFVSPNFHEPDGRAFLAILLLTFGSLTLYRPRPTLPRFLVIYAGAALGLISVRNIPLFGLTALPLLVLHLDEFWRRLPDPGGVRRRFEVTAGQTSTLQWALPVTILLCGLALTRGRVGSVQLIRDQFDASIFPARSVAKARAAGLEGRIFTDLAWGGYLVYSWPEQRIFIDGGTDFFGGEVFREYNQVRLLEPGWRELLKKWNISLVLARPNSALVNELAREKGWSLWYCDWGAALLRISPGTAVPSKEVDSAEHALEVCRKNRSMSSGDGNDRQSPR